MTWPHAANAPQHASISPTAPPLRPSVHQRTSTAPWNSTRQHVFHSDRSQPQHSSRFDLRVRSTRQLRIPHTIYSVCQTAIRLNITSVRCNSCSGWCHFPTCSDLGTTSRMLSNVASCCRNLPPQQPSTASPNHTVRQPFSRGYSCNKHHLCTTPSLPGSQQLYRDA